MRIHRFVVGTMIACAMVVLLAACSGGDRSAPATSDDPPPQLAPGELKLIFGAQPDDTVLVHADGSFEVVQPERTSRRACGGVCPRRVERFVAAGDKILQGSRELLSRAANGTVDMLGLGQVTIDDDGALIESGQRHAIDASGRLPHVDGEVDVTIVGATTPQLRRRAMLVLVFVGLVAVGEAIDLGSH